MHDDAMRGICAGRGLWCRPLAVIVAVKATPGFATKETGLDQFLLQQGLFVADVCYYYGDDAPAFVPGRDS